MSSEIGLAVRASVMYVHTLVDAAWNQTASKPATEQCDEKSGNVCNQTGRSRGLGIDFGMAAGTDHVRRSRSNRNDRGNDGWPVLLWHVRNEGTGRRNASHGLCVAGWSRRWRHREPVGRWWRLLLAHYEIFSFLQKRRMNQASNGESSFLPGSVGTRLRWQSFFQRVSSRPNCNRGFPRFPVQKKSLPLQNTTHWAAEVYMNIFLFHFLNLAFF